MSNESQVCDDLYSALLVEYYCFVFFPVRTNIKMLLLLRRVVVKEFKLSGIQDSRMESRGESTSRPLSLSSSQLSHGEILSWQ